MNPRDSRHLAALQDEQLARRAQAQLLAFVASAWPILEPATPFQRTWHIEVLCEYLEAITLGQIRRLVINIPPRYGKSLLVSVLWPCWEWITHPSTRWLFVSYAETLAGRHALDRRRLLRSPWYQRHWGHTVRLTPDQQAKLEFHNTLRGAMVATSVGGSVTGKGGNRLVLDDPHNPTQAESDIQRQHAIDFYTQTLSTRLDDKQRDATVLVMQRLHTRDLSAVCLELGFEHVALPALAPTRTTVVFPRSGRIVIREPEAPLWPAREDRAQLEVQRRALGSYGFAGQYQQQPSPRGGGLFKRDWFQFYDELPANLDQYAQSWDLSFKGGDDHDYVVGLVAARKGPNIYLIDRFKQHASFHTTCQAIKRFAAQYPRATAIYVEDAANGPAVIDALKHQVGGLIAVPPEGGKFSRAAACEPRVEAGNVWLPRPTALDGTRRIDRAWVEDFIEQCAIFPKGEHDDDVDAFTQLLVCWRHPLSTLTAGQILRAMREDPKREPRQF